MRKNCFYQGCHEQPNPEDNKTIEKKKSVGAISIITHLDVIN